MTLRHLIASLMHSNIPLDEEIFIRILDIPNYDDKVTRSRRVPVSHVSAVGHIILKQHDVGYEKWKDLT